LISILSFSTFQSNISLDQLCLHVLAPPILNSASALLFQWRLTRVHRLVIAARRPRCFLRLNYWTYGKPVQISSNFYLLLLFIIKINFWRLGSYIDNPIFHRIWLDQYQFKSSLNSHKPSIFKIDHLKLINKSNTLKFLAANSRR
jgi:hypothetical protein